MKNTILLILMLAIGACTEEASLQASNSTSGEPSSMIRIEEIRTLNDLRSYLDQRFGDVEELPVNALITSGLDTRVPFSYRLGDGRELTVPIIFTASNEQIVDPEFDLESVLN